ncbi:MAG TPA: aldose epimerase family protein [Bacteroidales bacterium]|nr:aldose epimerase family protein [Bacteroidales bacterium]
MSIITKEKVFSVEGRDIFIFKIQNSSGAYIEILNYGAYLVSVVVPDNHMQFGNIVLNYKNIDNYYSDKLYLGSAIIGRVANRIAEARFNLNENEYFLDRNDGNNCLHGGGAGLNKKILDYSLSEGCIIFTGVSSAGESGFPGEMFFSVRVSFSDKNELTFEYKASSDITCPVNFTNHAYFNLSRDHTSILNYKLKVNASEYLEMNNEFLPTGKILQMKNTSYDFTGYKKIWKMMAEKNESIKGYNTYFICRDYQVGRLKNLASVIDENSGRRIDVFSTMPGMLLYTGDYLTGEHLPFSGICLEAQHYPDFVNHANFPQSIAGPQHEFHEIIKFEFHNYQEYAKYLSC